MNIPYIVLIVWKEIYLELSINEAAKWSNKNEYFKMKHSIFVCVFSNRFFFKLIYKYL